MYCMLYCNVVYYGQVGEGEGGHGACGGGPPVPARRVPHAARHQGKSSQVSFIYVFLCSGSATSGSGKVPRWLEAVHILPFCGPTFNQIWRHPCPAPWLCLFGDNSYYGVFLMCSLIMRWQWTWRVANVNPFYRSSFIFVESYKKISGNNALLRHGVAKFTQKI